MKKEIKVLIIEDNQEHYEIITRYINRYNNIFQFINALNIEEANNIILSEKPDIILCDWRLPESDTLNFINRNNIFFPIVLMTSFGSEELAVRLLKLGVMDYIVKSIDNLKNIGKILLTAYNNWQNIQAKKKAEVEFERISKEWQKTFDSANDAIFILNKDHQLIRYNKKTIEFFNIKNGEDILNKKCWEIIHKDITPFKDCPEEEIKKTLQRKIIEIEINKKFFEITIDPLLDENNEFYGTIHFIRDITERKIIEKLLKKSEQRFRDLVFISSDFILEFTSSMIITFCSDQVTKILGYTPSEMINKSFFDFLHPDSKSNLILLQENIHPLKDIELIILDAYKNKRFILFSRIPILNENNKIIGFRGICKDINQWKELQNQLIEQSKFSALGLLSAGIAHEFNNILSIILSSSELLYFFEDYFNPEKISEAKHYLSVIKESVNRGKNIVKDLMAYTRPKELVIKPVDIFSVVNKSVNFQKKMLELENINIEIVNNSSKLSLIDESQLEQVFINLILNSRDAIKPKGKGFIKIIIETNGEYNLIKFIDNGIGIPEEQLDKIFTPFFTTKGPYSTNNLGLQGTGLGLSICYSIIQRHNGSIQVKSKFNEGATFIIKLPTTDEKTINQQNQISEQMKIEKEEIMKNKKFNILIVDDEKEFIILFKTLLSLKGITNIKSTNKAFSALELIKKEKFDVIFLDMILPEMNGEQLLNEIRKINVDVPIVFISGKLGVDENKFKNKNVVAFISKPFNIDEVLNVIDKL
ncbi:MAG TPA: response regulator [bacterium]|nr:response regulator [bacterium]HPQ18018.1 response regulator [bacterium]